MNAHGESQASGDDSPQTAGPEVGGDAASESNAAQKPADGAESDRLDLLLKQIHEFGEYVSYYVMAQIDRWKLTARIVVLRAVLGAVAFLIVVAMVVMASWLLLAGMVGAFGELCGDRLWAGQLITGVLVLGGLGIAASLSLTRQARYSRERTVEKYEERQERQRARFDHDVSERAEAATDESE